MMRIAGGHLGHLPWVDKEQKSDKMLDMKRITARDFQKGFGKLAQSLSDGQSVEVTFHGQQSGQFTKGSGRRIETPDFLANLRKTGCDAKLGDRVLEEFNASLS